MKITTMKNKKNILACRDIFLKIHLLRIIFNILN